MWGEIAIRSVYLVILTIFAQKIPPSPPRCPCRPCRPCHPRCPCHPCPPYHARFNWPRLRTVALASLT